MRRTDLISLSGLCAALLLAAAWSAGTHRHEARLYDASLPLPRIAAADGRIILIAPGAGEVRYALDGSAPDGSSPLYTTPLAVGADAVRTARLIATPTSVQWRHPEGSFPSLGVVRARAFEGDRMGPVRTFTVPPPAGEMMVISIVLPPGAFFDPDTGIYVAGHGIFHDEEESVRRYPEDQRWWKYPGNYQFRGGAWERGAHVEVFKAGREAWSGGVRLRIHGNNTRGFPQHALRLSFGDPVRALDGRPHDEVVLRTAGNDQNGAFLRDAVQHRLCAGLPFETSATVHAVVFVNGAYWGIHEVRERIDDDELALRHQVKRKSITILADRALLYRGDSAQVKEFLRLVHKAGHMDPASPAYVDSMAARLDVEGFLGYMAAQAILGNTDWPDQNVKYWNTKADRRWKFIMGDSDLGLGYQGGAEFDLLAHVAAKRGPVASLFNGLMRNRTLRERFRARMDDLLNGPLSADAMEAAIRTMADGLRGEMPAHIRRWRRPLSFEAWERNVADLLTFAHERGTVVRRQMDRHLPPLP